MEIILKIYKLDSKYVEYLHSIDRGVEKHQLGKETVKTIEHKKEKVQNVLSLQGFSMS